MYHLSFIPDVLPLAKVCQPALEEASAGNWQQYFLQALNEPLKQMRLIVFRLPPVQCSSMHNSEQGSIGLPVAAVAFCKLQSPQDKMLRHF